MEYNKSTLDTILKISRSSSKDQTRYQLCGVHVQAANGKVTIQATDGHIMAQVTLHDDLLPTGEYLIPTSDIPIIKAMLKTCHKGLSRVDIPYSMPTIGETRYPNTASFTPKLDDTWFQLDFDAKLLSRLAESLGTGKTDALTLRFKDVATPMLITMHKSESDHIGVLMPCRGTAASVHDTITARGYVKGAL